MKKRLLVTASTFPRWKGDTEPRFVLDISKHMLQEFDVSVLVPATPGAKDEEIMEGVHVIRYHYFPIHKWETLCYPGAIVPRVKEKKIRTLLVPCLFFALWINLFKIRNKYDAIHAHWIIPQGIVQSFINKPFVITGHGGDVVSFNKGFIRKLKERCIERASAITVVSDYLKEKINEISQDSVVDVISMGVDTEQFGPEFRCENYFGQGKQKVILFVGRLVEIKGVTYLIEAMKEVDALLVIAGEGPLKETLMKQAEENNSNVMFVGSKTHEELKYIYASADIFVAPSIITERGEKEGFGLVYLEAMASGIPVIVSEETGFATNIRDGINGMVVRPKSIDMIVEKINALLTNQDLYQNMVSRSQDIVRRYDYKEIAKNYCDVINRVMK